MDPRKKSRKGLDTLQKISISLMAVLVLVTFVGANLHAVLWKQSSWLVSSVLPSVVVELTNDERAENAAAPLRRNATLDAAAKLKAQHMAKNEYFSHYSPTGVSPWHWFSEAGYLYAHAGENLAIHFTDSSEVVEAWMNSPTHRANIVDQKFTEIGVGTARGTYDGFDTVYVVQLFGAPAVVPEPEPADVAEQNEDTTAEVLVQADSQPEVLAEATDTASFITPEPRSESAAQPVAETASATPQTTNATETPSAASSTEPSAVRVTKEVPPQPPVTMSTSNEDTVVLETTISTSSGLAVATYVEPNEPQAGTTVISMATQPNELLQWVYMLLGTVVMGLLLFSAAFEARRFHYLQVTYSFALMLAMGGLWYVHTLLTSGAVIV